MTKEGVEKKGERFISAHRSVQMHCNPHGAGRALGNIRSTRIRLVDVECRPQNRH